jgi:hypothetical protein
MKKLQRMGDNLKASFAFGRNGTKTDNNQDEDLQ